MQVDDPLNEDALTAAVFQRIAYLPDRRVTEILFNSDLWQAQGGEIPRSIDRIEFWPRWAAAGRDGTTVPDLIIEFADRILVIEAKRWDYVQLQSPRQLAAEFLAAQASFPGKSIWLLAVGGLRSVVPTTIRALGEEVRQQIGDYVRPSAELDVRLTATTWPDLLALVHRGAGDEPHAQRVARDIEIEMRRYGVSSGRRGWFNDLTTSEWACCRPIIASAAAFRE